MMIVRKSTVSVLLSWSLDFLLGFSFGSLGLCPTEERAPLAKEESSTRVYVQGNVKASLSAPLVPPELG
jgi:hypothetical protein